MWGCTVNIFGFSATPEIVPTHVGVYRIHGKSLRIIDNCPHACGGVPKTKVPVDRELKLSPRMWGCTERTYAIYRY